MTPSPSGGELPGHLRRGQEARRAERLDGHGPERSINIESDTFSGLARVQRLLGDVAQAAGPG
ncbi:MAG: hypothetical protein JO100_03665 [Pseudonocardia sp.]|nr:hypothetical protein [Pseudonocardia sp.]